jgi:uncharacterized protein HemX
MSTLALILIALSLTSGGLAYFGFRRANTMKKRAMRAEAKSQAYAERMKERAVAEQELRIKLAESQDLITKMKEVKTDEEAVAVLDDWFTRVGKL